MIKVVFTKKFALPSHRPVEYYVETDNYKIAKRVARAQLEKDKSSYRCYDRVIMIQITPLRSDNEKSN